MKELTDYQCLCPNCGCVRTFKERVRKRNREGNCKECSFKLRTKPKKRFKRVCDTCGDIKISDRPIRSKSCLSCSRKRIGENLISYRTSESYQGKTSYHYFCRYCSSVRVLSARRKTSTCSICSRKYEQKKKLDTIYFNLEDMLYRVPVRYFKVCKWCGVTKQLKQALHAGIGSCNKCKHLDVNIEEVVAKRKKTLEANSDKTGRKKGSRNTQYSKEAIEKVREENRAHKAAQQNKPKLITQTLTEEEMISEWLEKNEITKADTQQLDDVYLGQVNIKGAY